MAACRSSSLASNTAALFVVVIFVIGFPSCSVGKCPTGDNPNNITWCSTGEDTFKSNLDGKYDDKGLQPWYNLGVSFIGTVLGKDAELYAIILKAKDGSINSAFIKDDIALGYAVGLLVCCAFGILFCILMPIVGFCFCCCRCCGKCGGDMMQMDDPGNACKRAVFAIILLIITLLMLSGVLLTFVCNDRMSNSLDAFKTTGNNVIDEAKGFIGRTLKDVDKVIDEFQFSVGNIKTDISDQGVQSQVGDPVFNEISPIVKDPIEKVKDLSAETKTMSNQLNIINNNTKSLQASSKALQTKLNTIKNKLDPIVTSCAGAGLTCPDTSSLTLDADFNNVPNITAELDSVQDIVNNDFAGAAEEGFERFKEIPKTLINKTRDARQDITKFIGEAQKQVNDLVSNLSSSVNNTVYKNLDSGRESLDKYIAEGKVFDKYRWYAGVGLTCILLLIMVLLGLGLMCGVCGYDKEAVPTTRGSVSNMGGLSLMAAVGFCFIFASFLMLLTTICLIIGAPLQKVCEGLENDGFYKHVLDTKDFMGAGKGYLLGELLYQNGSIDLTIHGILESCRANKPIYDAAKVKYKINIKEKFNIKKLMGDTVDKALEDLNTNLTDQEILTPEAETNLGNLSKTGVENIDFEKFLNETQKSITKVNLTEFAGNVSKMAEGFQKARQYDNGNKSMNISIDLINLDQVTVAEMKAKSVELDKNVKQLNDIGGNLKNKSKAVLDSARSAETYVQDQAGEKIKKVVQTYADRVLGWGYQFTDHLQDVLENDLAKCKPVSNIHDAMISAICKEAVYPFNGFWLAIGFCLFFFIPAIIFSVKLAKHYRRMNYESDFDQAYDQNEMYELGSRGGQPILPQYQSVGPEKKLWAQPQHNPAYPNQH